MAAIPPLAAPPRSRRWPGWAVPRAAAPLLRRMSGSLLVMLAAILTVIVVWFRNPPGWTDVLGMIAMVGALILLAHVMASMWP